MASSRSLFFIVLTLVGTMASWTLFAKVCEWFGLFQVVGWTIEGFILGGLSLAGLGVVSILYLARDVAVWALKATPASEWKAEHASQEPIVLSALLSDVLTRTSWRWRAPALYIFPDKEINAVAMSVGRNRSLIMLSSTLVEQGSKTEIEAALMHSVLRLVEGEMTALLMMFGMIIPMTLFPARMMALILGTSLRSAEEETPSDEVETIMLVIHEVCLVLLGSLAMRYFARSNAGRADRTMMTTPFEKAFVKLLERDAATRTSAHREMLTAPFCMLNKVRGPIVGFYCVRPTKTRVTALEH